MFLTLYYLAAYFRLTGSKSVRFFPVEDGIAVRQLLFTLLATALSSPILNARRG